LILAKRHQPHLDAALIARTCSTKDRADRLDPQSGLLPPQECHPALAGGVIKVERSKWAGTLKLSSTPWIIQQQLQIALDAFRIEFFFASIAGSLPEWLGNFALLPESVLLDDAVIAQYPESRFVPD